MTRKRLLALLLENDPKHEVSLIAWARLLHSAWPGLFRFRRTTRSTSALPGTPEKMAVMRRRAERRQELFHVADASWDGTDGKGLAIRCFRNGAIARVGVVECQGEDRAELGDGSRTNRPSQKTPIRSWNSHGRIANLMEEDS